VLIHQCQRQWNAAKDRDQLRKLFGAERGEAMKAVGLQQEAIGNEIKAFDTGGSFRSLLGRLEIRFVFAVSVLSCMTGVAIYLTPPPAKLPAMEPVLYAPNAELLRHRSDRPEAGCRTDLRLSFNQL
jgi:hypothetical protein